MPKTYTEQLDEVQAAITAIMVRGQRYTIDGRSFEKADLNTLFDMQKHLRPLADREARGGVRVRYGTPQG